MRRETITELGWAPVDPTEDGTYRIVNSVRTGGFGQIRTFASITGLQLVPSVPDDLQACEVVFPDAGGNHIYPMVAGSVVPIPPALRPTCDPAEAIKVEIYPLGAPYCGTDLNGRAWQGNPTPRSGSLLGRQVTIGLLERPDLSDAIERFDYPAATTISSQFKTLTDASGSSEDRLCQYLERIPCRGYRYATLSCLPFYQADNPPAANLLIACVAALRYDAGLGQVEWIPALPAAPFIPSRDADWYQQEVTFPIDPSWELLEAWLWMADASSPIDLPSGTVKLHLHRSAPPALPEKTHRTYWQTTVDGTSQYLAGAVASPTDYYGMAVTVHNPGATAVLQYQKSGLIVYGLDIGDPKDVITLIDGVPLTVAAGATADSSTTRPHHAYLILGQNNAGPSEGAVIEIDTGL